ncbi:MAG: type II toxin-antitoxin system VapC family toxin [Candidatus Riflebacteria bacterium]|nr:type II toxin-antitoxin system VapC family toxin [Candidatus Riflebacteria bacterium]
MKAFLDTSSLLKLYHKEEFSEDLENFLIANVDEIFLSRLAMLEFSSAIWRKVRTDEIEEIIAKEVILCFQNDQNSFRWINLQESIIKAANDLLMKYGKKGLRSLDSVQFASALTLREEDFIFITSDIILKSLFLEEKLKTPEQEF